MREMPSQEKPERFGDFGGLRDRYSEVSTPRSQRTRRMNQLCDRLVGDLDETLAALRHLIATSNRPTF